MRWTAAHRVRALIAVCCLAAASVTALPAAQHPAVAAPTGFQDTVIWKNLVEPTAIAFVRQGRVFVAEKSGIIKTFDSLQDPTPSVFADLRPVVFGGWDRGLLGLAVDPDFGSTGGNFIYVLYTADATPNGPTPSWHDDCPGPPDGPGPTTDGCPVTGTLSRIKWKNGTAGRRAGPDPQPMVPAVPESLDGQPRLRARRVAVRLRRRGRELQLSRLRAGRRHHHRSRHRRAVHAGQPVRRSARHGRHRVDVAERDGWVAPLPEHATTRAVPPNPERVAAACGPGDRLGPARQPDGVQRRCERAARHRLRVPQPVPVRDPTRDRRGVGGRRWPAEVGGDRPDPGGPEQRDQRRLAVLRGGCEALGVRGARSVQEPLRRRGKRRRHALLLL